MVVIAASSRAMQRLRIVTFPVLACVISLDQVPPGCLRPLFFGDLICEEMNPGSYWLYLALLVAAALTSGYFLAHTFRKDDPEMLHDETKQLRRWSKGVMSATGGTLTFPPRSLLAAWLIVALWVGPLLWLAIKHQAIYPVEFQLEFFGTLTLGSLLLWLPVRWFSESLSLTPDGIRYRHLLKWGGLLPWNYFRSIELKSQSVRGSQAIRLHAPWLWPDIVVNRNTIRDQERFTLASRFIIHRALDADVPIHLPVSGIANWIDEWQS